MKPNLKQYIIVTGPLFQRGGVGYRGLMVPLPPPPPLFQKSNFAANVFLQIRFCVILQGI